MDIYVYKNQKRLTDSQKEKMRSVLSLMERNKVDGFKRENDAEISLLSRFLLRILAAARLGVNPEDIMFFYNEYNRPYLPDFDFNISHSGDWIVLAFSSKARVGIDVEKMRKVDSSLVKMCFTEEEQEYVITADDFNQENFFELWTLKESFIKADGKGLSYPLQDFYFQLGDKININFKTEKEKCDWHFRSYDLDPNYKFSVCSDLGNFPAEPIIIEDINDFL